MKVRDLINAIKHGKRTYADFLDWDVAVEIPLEIDVYMENDILVDGDEWKYCKCHGYNTYMLKDKVFSVNIHY